MVVHMLSLLTLKIITSHDIVDPVTTNILRHISNVITIRHSGYFRLLFHKLSINFTRSEGVILM